MERPRDLSKLKGYLSDVEGIKFVYFSEKDVVRHKLVQAIVKAYERYEKRNPRRLNPGRLRSF